METRIIAFAGKGGVGKTSLAALTVKLLTEAYPEKRVLAVDADPAVGLATALGVEVERTVNDIRLSFIDDLKKPAKPSTVEIMNEVHYELTSAIVDAGDFAFLAIGRPEGAGCYCSVNGFLKEVIGSLCADFDYVVIDGEAGIEQINRRVMEKVTDLVLVSDASKKGINVIRTIRDVAQELTMFSRAGAIINRVTSEEIKPLVDTGDVPLLGFIDEDRAVTLADVQGIDLRTLPSDSRTVRSLKEALTRIGIF